MQLPEIRRNVFLYICAFLQELLNHSQDNGLDAKTLGEDRSFLVEMFNPKLDDLFDLYNSNFFPATLFGSIFLRDPPRRREERSQRSRVTQATFDRKKAAFVYHFLVNDQSDFLSR